MKAFKNSAKALAWAVPLVLAAASAQAAGTGIPWEAPITSVTSSITGIVLTSVLSLLVVGAGVAMAMSSSQGVQRFSQLIMGGSTAAGFLFFLGWFGAGAGAMI
jgi:type IV secretory pathway VirB2 component (pilin)